jgi:hypothetical protein
MWTIAGGIVLGFFAIIAALFILALLVSLIAGGCAVIAIKWHLMDTAQRKAALWFLFLLGALAASRAFNLK